MVCRSSSSVFTNFGTASASSALKMGCIEGWMKRQCLRLSFRNEGSLATTEAKVLSASLENPVSSKSRMLSLEGMSPMANIVERATPGRSSLSAMDVPRKRYWSRSQRLGAWETEMDPRGR